MAKRRSARSHQGSLTTSRAAVMAKAMHAKHPAGHLTAAQYAADLANLNRARQAEATAILSQRGGSNFTGKRRKLNPTTPATSAQQELNRIMGTIRKRGGPHLSYGKTPLGTRRVTIRFGWEPSHRKPTGILRHMKRRIAPTGWLERTTWHSSRSHHFKKRIRLRKHKKLTVKHWHRRGRWLTPR